MANYKSNTRYSGKHSERRNDSRRDNRKQYDKPKKDTHLHDRLPGYNLFLWDIEWNIVTKDMFVFITSNDGVAVRDRVWNVMNITEQEFTNMVANRDIEYDNEPKPSEVIAYIDKHWDVIYDIKK